MFILIYILDYKGGQFLYPCHLFQPFLESLFFFGSTGKMSNKSSSQQNLDSDIDLCKWAREDLSATYGLYKTFPLKTYHMWREIYG